MSRELQMARLGLVSKFWRLGWWSKCLGLGRWASRSRAFTSRAHPWSLYL